jgi:Xaa-Pro aminopeptidase
MNERLKKLQEKLQEFQVDAILITNPENRYYISGFTGSAGYLFITPNSAYLNTDFRYIEQATNQAPAFQIIKIDSEYEWFIDLLSKHKINSLGFESEDLSYAGYFKFTEIISKNKLNKIVNLKPLIATIEKIRAIKYADEIDILKEAIRISDEAMNTVAPLLYAGISEREVALKLENKMRELGAEGPSFDTIVGSGPNAALPHHRAGDRIIQNGEPIVIDMGAKYQGYCSDLTRTFCIGTPDETFRKVYDTVFTAQQTAISLVEQEMTGTDCDLIARNVIEEAGYGEQFGHSLGHGVGLAVHEYPRVSPNSHDILKNDMVFTIEPGIYIPGWGGVRIEDIITLQNNSAKVLSSATRNEIIGG